MTRGISSLDSLLETRRLIRSMRITSDKNTKEFEKIVPNYTKAISRNLNKQAKAIILQILKDSKNNIKLAEHIKTILSTHLFEPTNLNNKLQRQTKMILEENERLQKQSEEIIEGLANTSTKFDSTLKLILSDLNKRFARDLNVASKISLEDDETYGVLTLKSVANTSTLYVVIVSRDEGNFFKTFLNDVPTQFTDKNFTPFASPSQAYKAIKEILVQDGILR